MFFASSVQAENRYLHWDAEQQLLLDVSEEELATPIETINNIMISLLNEAGFTSNIHLFTSIPTKVNVTCLTYLKYANIFLEKSQQNAEDKAIRSKTKNIVNMIQEALKSSENSGSR